MPASLARLVPRKRNAVQHGGEDVLYQRPQGWRPAIWTQPCPPRLPSVSAHEKG